MFMNMLLEQFLELMINDKV